VDMDLDMVGIRAKTNPKRCVACVKCD